MRNLAKKVVDLEKIPVEKAQMIKKSEGRRSAKRL